jgi:acyl-coenzyme A synthetase/AMP-(fatty) acid ligase
MMYYLIQRGDQLMSHTDGALRLLSDYVKKASQERPDHVALIYGEQRITYQELARQSQNLACYLLKLGVQKGDRLAYLMTPRPEFFILYAASQIGALITESGRQSARKLNMSSIILRP